MTSNKYIQAEDLHFFMEMLSIDSTTGHERPFADFLAQRLRYGHCELCVTPEDVAHDQPVNLYFKWGKPRVVFCTHLDTVPPYIPPSIENLSDGDLEIRGRGSCDAKGQIMAMQMACRQLLQAGETDFGLLLLYGEESGSYGAKEFRHHAGAEFVIVGEPTDNRMVSASKGTKSFILEIKGEPFHSGYPQYGNSAIQRFVDIVNDLNASCFPIDPVLGETTYNIGMLQSDNPQNILSSSCTCRIYFRTTFASDQMVVDKMMSLQNEQVKVTACGGDEPSTYLVVDDMPTETVAFGSDAPQLTNFQYKSLCGAGSILVAHRPEENIKLSELDQCIENLINIFHVLKKIQTA